MFVSVAFSLASVSRVVGELECPGAAGPGSGYELVHISPSDSGHVLMTASADEARNTAVCHAICINYIFVGRQSPNGSNGTEPTNSTGPTNGTIDSDDSMEVCSIICQQFVYYI